MTGNSQPPSGKSQAGAEQPADRADSARQHTLTPLKGASFVVHAEDSDVLSLFGRETDDSTPETVEPPATPDPPRPAPTSLSRQDAPRRRAESPPPPLPPVWRAPGAAAIPVSTTVPRLPVAVPLPSPPPAKAQARRQPPTVLPVDRPAPLRVAAVGLTVAVAALVLGLVAGRQTNPASELRSATESPVSKPSLSAKAPSPARSATSSLGDGATVAPHPLGWLLVEAPFELTVFEGDERIGTSHEARLPLPTGRHTLRFVNLQFNYQHDADLVVNTGQVTRTAPPIPTGTLQITAAPWADVWVDDIKAGRTPLKEVRVAIGRHAVRFQHPTLGSRVRIATVLADTTETVTADFR